MFEQAVVIVIIIIVSVKCKQWHKSSENNKEINLNKEHVFIFTLFGMIYFNEFVQRYLFVNLCVDRTPNLMLTFSEYKRVKNS